MKGKILMALFMAVCSLTAMSCKKEYTCACDGYNQIVEASSTAEATTACKAKGPNCALQ